ncbi:MAG: N-acetylneuraminate synthase family protein [Nitrosopumilus sp.]
MSIFVIAEIGINHNGDIDIAKKLIDVAVFAKCNAVKFQKRTPDICVPKRQKNVVRETPWGRMSYIDYRHCVEFGLDEYKEIDRYCNSKNIHWFASAWDLDSLEFLQQFDLKYNKIASAMIAYIPLLKKVASEKKYTFISTGMSALIEIQKAIGIFCEMECPFEIMHCVSTYPMKTEDANLRNIGMLHNKFHCDVGYSGHEPGLVISYAAVALGATSIERHITLDRSMYGTDQAASLEPMGLYNLVDSIRKIEKALGNDERIVTKEEEEIRKRLRWYK